MQCQGQRGVLEIRFANTGHVHVPRAPVGVHRARLDGVLPGGGLSRRGSGLGRAGGVGWRLWALVPIVLLAVAVALVVSQGDRVVDLVGGTPPPADEFDVRRVEFRHGEIRIEVRNPQRDDLTIALRHRRRRDRPVHASTARRRSAGCARARSSSRTTGSRTSRSRSASRARRASRRRTRSPPRVLTPAAERPRLPRLRADRAARRRRSRSRSGCSGCRRSGAPTRGGWRRSWR